MRDYAKYELRARCPPVDRPEKIKVDSVRNVMNNSWGQAPPLQHDFVQYFGRSNNVGSRPQNGTPIEHSPQLLAAGLLRPKPVFRMNHGYV
jgi:hypothetical protein